MMADKKSSAQPLVSVIVNCYNGEKFLKEALDSIYAQTYSNWEIIFWDNGSTDNSAMIVKSYDLRLKYFKSLDTLPLYAARNMALQKCSGEFVTFLDCDDLWLKNKLALQVKTMLEHDYALIYSSFYVVDSAKKIKRKYSVKNSSGNVFSHIAKHYNIAILTVMLRRSFLDKHALHFDDDSKYFGDFTLFCLIASMSSVGVIPDFLCLYREHDGALSSKMNLIDHKMEHNIMKAYLHARISESNYKLLAQKIDYFYDASLIKLNLLNGDAKLAKLTAKKYLMTDLKLSVCYFMLYLPALLRRRLLKNYMR